MLFGAVMAYGTHPDWTQFEHGLQIIMLSRRLQWPLVTAALLLSIALIALVISGKRRAWWLIGLAPVLALFVHRFALRETLHVLDEPNFAAPDAAHFIADEDYVVGLTFGEQAYAYPFATLNSNPVVAHAHHDQRMLLMWAPFANRATAVSITRELKGRDLDVVCMPAGALLIFNRRIGQFVNGLTAKAIDDATPHGFRRPIPATKTTWKRWREAHPRTRVLAVAQRVRGPSAPLLPRPKMPLKDVGMPPATRVLLVAAAQPLALLAGEIGAEPMNLKAGDTPILLFRDGAGVVRAFDRHVESDLAPAFKRASDRRHKNAAFVDAYTETLWSIEGVALNGELKGRRLAPVPVEEDLHWGVMKYWYPQLALHRSVGATRPAE